jgi:hypothetical protein
MTLYVVLILAGVVGGVVLLGILTQYLEGTSRHWKELEARFPPQAPAPDATTGGARIHIGHDPRKFLARGCMWFFTPWTWTRGLQQISYAVDDDFLHMETEGGRYAPRSGVSIPWAELRLAGEVSTHMGVHALLWIDDLAISFPSALIERELEVRRALAEQIELDEPGGEGDAGNEVRWSEDIR